MFQINGSVQVIPTTVHTESGTLRVEEGQPSQPAVVQTLVTLSGPVQVIYPADAVDKVIEGLVTAKEDALNKKSANLYVPSSMQEAESLAKSQQQIKGGPNEVDGS